MNWTLDYNYTLTISGTGAMDDYEQYRQNPWSFKGIKRVVINDGITTIGEWAFSGCTSLISVTISDSVKTIGASAFTNCESLPSVIIPDGVTTIGEDAFWNCVNLRSVIISDSVKTIGKNAFRGCKNLKEIRIPDGVTFIGDEAFRNCRSLTEVKIPVDIKNFGWKVFEDCINLEKIYYRAGSVSEYKLREGNNAQLIPYNPAQFVYKPTVNVLKFMPVANPTPQLSDEKLYWEIEGKTLTVGGVSEIKSYSYEATPWVNELRNIQSIIVGEGVEKISARAFENCTRLEQVIISASVKTIGDFAFTICYCGDRKINNGTNVIWSLEDGTLMIKKNPAAKSDSDFSTGDPTWEFAEKNITGVKIERGIVPGKRFFDWLAHMGDSVQVSF